MVAVVLAVAVMGAYVALECWLQRFHEDIVYRQVCRENAEAAKEGE